MIAIPNIKKPKSCAECPFEVIGISGYPRCVIMQEMVVDGNLFNRCPLIDIVRCGDGCKYFDHDGISDYGRCSKRDVYEWHYKPTDFCSYGIGRE